MVFRFGCFVPVPGVNPDAMLAMMQAQGGGIHARARGALVAAGDA